jgi:hypothetical protein
LDERLGFIHEISRGGGFPTNYRQNRGVTLSSFSKCRTFQFAFDHESALYTDHFGHRVLADVEGSGSYTILEAPDRSSHSVDGGRPPESSGHFDESFILTASRKGPSRVSALLGEGEVDEGPTVTVDHFLGCGWILKSKSVRLVDGVADGWNGMGQIQPIPVFLGAEGEGLVVRPVEGRCQLLAELDMADPKSLADRGWKVKNCSKLFDLKSELPGFGPLEGKVLSHLNQGSFRVKVIEGCQGIVIRKLYDAFHGRQRARVIVDGGFAGWWFEPWEDRLRRWRWGFFGFGMDEVTGRPSDLDSMEILIDPAAGTPLWSVSRYEVCGVFSAPRGDAFG